MAALATHPCCCRAVARRAGAPGRRAAAARGPLAAAPAVLSRAALLAPRAARRAGAARRRHGLTIALAVQPPLAPQARAELSSRVLLAAAAAAAAALAACCGARHAPPLLAALDVRVLGSSLAAVAKLAAICYLVRRMNRAGRLPAGLPPALASLSFELLLPCFLFSRVAATLAAAPPGAGLLALPALAAAQVALGGALGAAVWSLVDGSAAAALRRAFAARWTRGRWHPTRRPARSATAVATALALATGAPALAAAVAPPPPPVGADGAPPEAPHAWRLVVTASAFGNSVTLPLLFLTQLLPAAEAVRAAGLCALFMVGWSPLLWSAGWRVLAPPGCDERPAAAGAPPPPPAPRARAPLLLPYPAGSSRSARLTDAARVAWRRFAQRCELCTATLAASLNPQLIGVLMGVVVGVTPLSALMLPGTAAAASAAAAGVALRPPPLELALFAAAARCCADAAALLGDAALPVGTLVLATALSPPIQQPATKEVEVLSAYEPQAASSSSVGDVSAALMAGGARGAAVAALVRLLLLPAACVALGAAASQAGLLPADPALRLVLLAQSAMPSAQNLVLLLALRRGTAAAAPRFAAQILRQYILAALPVAAWMSLFVRSVH